MERNGKACAALLLKTQVIDHIRTTAMIYLSGVSHWRSNNKWLTFVTYLQPVDQFFLNGILSCGIGGHTEPLGSFSQPLLLVLVVGVGSRSLRAQNTTQAFIKTLREMISSQIIHVI